MADISREQVIDFLSKLNVIEMAKLVEELEAKWGVKAATAVAAVAAAPAAAAAAEAAPAEEEKTSFDVVLATSGEKKIAVIKVVRAVTGLGLKEAKDLVDTCPKVLKEGADKDEAQKIKKEIEEAGGTVEIR